MGEPGKAQKVCQKESKNHIKKAPLGKGHAHMLMGWWAEVYRIAYKRPFLLCLGKKTWHASSWGWTSGGHGHLKVDHCPRSVVRRPGPSHTKVASATMGCNILWLVRPQTGRTPAAQTQVDTTEAFGSSGWGTPMMHASPSPPQLGGIWTCSTVWWPLLFCEM